MSTGPTTLPAKGLRAGAVPRRWLPRLRDTRIRSKLALLLVVPVAAVLALATIRLVDIGQGAYQAGVLRSLTELSADVSALTQDVHKERIAAARLLAKSKETTPEVYDAYVQRTDARIAAYNDRRTQVSDVPASVEDRLRVIDDRLATLNGTRQEVLERPQMPPGEATLRYGMIIGELVAYGETLGQISGESAVGDSLRTLSALAQAKEAVAEEEAVVYSALAVGGVLDQQQFSAFIATLTSQQEALLAFGASANSRQESVVNGSVTGDAVILADKVARDLTRSVGQRSPVSASSAAIAIGSINDLMRWAETLLERDLLDQAEAARSEVVQQAIVESIVVLLTLIIALALAVVLARSLNQSLRRLREGALSVANHDLPEAVRRLRDVGTIGEGGVDEIVRQVRDPIRLNNKDEVGQVALAFNVVHKEAVRIAAEQAALRTSVSAMFLSLARRSQTLVDRMIGELDAIERGEEDPKRLAQLFELDHLATRMRRNDENLLVLAGADSTAPRRDDALLIDVLRAAQSEVELYNRIEFGTVDPDISVAAHAVNDVVRLVAELLDNATRFSPPHTTVVADARRIRDYVLIQVEDRGLGLSEEQMDALNRRLAELPAVDVAAFRLMGLAVVGRLAHRHEIRVDLRRNVEGGTVAQVTLPASTVVLPGPRGRDQMLARQRQPLAVEPGPAAARPSTGAAWQESLSPVGAARSGGSLTDQWRNAGANQWQTTGDQTGAMPAGAPGGNNHLTGAPVNSHLAGGQLPATPTPGYQQHVTPSYQTPASTAPPAHTGLAGAGMASPTVQYPTVASSLPQRGAAGSGPAPTHAMTPAAGTPSGLPSGPVAGAPVNAASAVAPRVEDTGEAPIFREMEAVWFRSHGSDSTAIFTVPPGGYQAPPSGYQAPPSAAPSPMATPGRTPLTPRTPGRSAPPPAPYSPPTPPPAPVPAPAAAPPPVPAPAPAATPAPAAPAGTEGSWQTAADEGWARASRAAEPASGGTTRSGLPKRVPQAQLVPGGVETRSGRERSRRTPDEVRGLLSAYHRGVQRGRTAGSEQNGMISTKETSG
ncbi:nitrate- and nitrite sensing domain-containing protein [Micromonospora sp. WMMD1102]|uniref:sensor histidine kinase n=1 Tax=Micromonospora sp. WMMD1102 TaxID=3016105 RepID=UPI002414FE8F|nr:sensor histidine kinase [Micromonospora sp. WMMD1102]MDG4789917.1 nitrate- and nitrite sensing domain-containing protein [Micromonospora sp. WMMD1102]